MTPETEPLYFYYCNDGSTIEGPYEWEQIPELLEVGAVSRDTAICLAGAEEWSALGDYLPPAEHEVGDAAGESPAESWAVEETEELFESSDSEPTVPRATFVARLHRLLPTKRGKWAAAAGGGLLLTLLGLFGAHLLRQEGAEQTVPTNANIDAAEPTAERWAWAIEPRFQKADSFVSFGVARVQLGGKWGLIDRTGRELLPCAYEEIEIFPKENCAAVREGSKWGLVDAEGKILAKPEWEEVQPLVNGFIPVKKDGKWGYADASGKLVIPCTWDNAWRFSAAGTAVVTKETREGGKRGYIDKSGRVITELEWDGAQTMSPEGLGAVRRDMGWALVDKNGKLLGEPQWGMQWRFLRADLGFLPVCKGGQWGIVALDGKVLVEPAWEFVAPAKNGVLLSKPGTKAIFVGAGGQTLFETGPWDEIHGIKSPYDWEEVRGFSEGLLAVRAGDKWGFIDETGKTVIPTGWHEVGDFHEGLAAVKKESDRQKSWEFIKTDGSPAFAVPAGLKIGNYWRAPRFRNGMVKGQKEDGAPVLVDREGKVEREWREHSWLPEGTEVAGTRFPYVSRFGRYGYMRNFADAEGKIFMRDVPVEMSSLADPFPYPGRPRYGLASADGKVLVEPKWDRAEIISPEWVRVWLDEREGLVNARGEQILKP
ncbi:MAG: WG repeat-containing protein, partial [Sphaerospermopsis kisseleviana]